MVKLAHSYFESHSYYESAMTSTCQELMNSLED